MIRAARADDYEAFARLFAEIDSGDTVPSHAQFDDELLPKMIVFEQAGEVVGYSVLVLVDPVVAHVSELAVAPEARRRGVGRVLLSELAARAERAGRSLLSLNVRENNEPAVGLYERFGFVPIYRQKALCADWDVVDAWADAVHPARPIEPADDARVEAAFELAPGTFAAARALEDRLLRMVERDGEVAACAVFHVRFPGAVPFRAKTPADAISMLRALRRDARPGDTILKVNALPDIADALLARGVRLRYGLVHMRRPLGQPSGASGASATG